MPKSRRLFCLACFILIFVSAALPYATHAEGSTWLTLPASLPTNQQSKLLASDSAASDNFGGAVALSADGMIALVGAPHESSGITQRNGAVYVYVLSGGVWTEQAKLLAADKTDDAYFGASIALSPDGSMALIGATNRTYDNDWKGAAYVFVRNGNTWTQQTRLIPSDTTFGNHFGSSVTLSNDGTTALIGADHQNDSGTVYNGAVYVFTYNGSVWTEQAKLLATGKKTGDFFGWSVALSSDGSTALIGASRQNEATQFQNGAAYVFTRNAGTWTQQAKLLNTSLEIGLTNQEYFGWSVAISSDGNTALITGVNARDDAALFNDTGAAFVFVRSGSIWTLQSRIDAPSGQQRGRFGESAVLSPDGNTAFIGATTTDSIGTITSGLVYAFTRSGSTWASQGGFTATDFAEDDFFGYSVGLSNDGNTLLVGAASKDGPGVQDRGAAYIFKSTLPATPTPTSTPNPARPDTVGVYKDGIFYLRNTNTTGVADITAVFGGDPSDLPVTGDWNGDGMDTIGVYRSSTGFFFLSDSNTLPSVAYTVLLGNPDDTPFAGKWRLDMVGSGVGVFRPSNGVLYQKRELSSGFSDYFAVYGNPGDVAFAGDWNGDGKDSIGVYRSSNKNWYVTNDSEPGIFPVTDFFDRWDVPANAIPVVGDWNSDGLHTIGYLSAAGDFVLHSSLWGSASNVFLAFGPAGSKPIAGKWTLPVLPPSAVRVINPSTDRGNNDTTGASD